MKYTFHYADNDSFYIENIAVVGDFNNWDPHTSIMELCDDGLWKVEVYLSPGQYRYKLLINDYILLNDPTSTLYVQDENGAMKSLIIINDDGTRMINVDTLPIEICAYHLSNDFIEAGAESLKHSFIAYEDKNVVCKFGFKNVTGIHTVSVLWFAPGDIFYSLSESVLWRPEGEEYDIVTLWFWLDIHSQALTTGEWTLKLFIDGAYILKDSFELLPAMDNFFNNLSPGLTPEIDPFTGTGSFNILNENFTSSDSIIAQIYAEQEDFSTSSVSVPYLAGNVLDMLESLESSIPQADISPDNDSNHNHANQHVDLKIFDELESKLHIPSQEITTVQVSENLPLDGLDNDIGNVFTELDISQNIQKTGPDNDINVKLPDLPI